MTAIQPSPPAGRLIGTFEPGSDEWHAARANGIGGSEIAAVLGLSPHESRFSLWHRKQGNLGPMQETPEMYWGKKHEPTICAEFTERHPELLVLPSGTYQADDAPWWIANPDRLGFTADGGLEVIEAKTAYDDFEWGDEGTDQIPLHYKAQVRWYCRALGAQCARIAVLFGLSDYREYVVEADDEDAHTMYVAGQEFMDSLASGLIPDIDGHVATFQAIKALPEGMEDVDVDILPELRDRYFAALDAFKAAEEEKRHAAGLVLDQIDTGRRAVVGKQRVATRTVRDGKTYSLQPARNRSTT
ncbi:putative phage-type endonuclease [Streptomyces sp. SAI-208]|uniref:YqaJ viral recombinase family nuclease n=1 Tax=Streptomyces sp. SAI-208 TaxID=2940550 RepID=UPI0024754C19|nr:YqaJ viral recombinase family protein [Streptomyces sp. SAI-208]MDH6610241.1 putative phage-type endonuclease [Streptomyces sp. SAI-208]